jgi:phenylacetate-CoA ligase
MLLLRDEGFREHSARLLEAHLAVIRSVHSGDCDLTAHYAGKLVDTLAVAAKSKLYSETLAAWRDEETVAAARQADPSTFLAETFAAVPLLEKDRLRDNSRDAFTRSADDFLHYYESSGTTGDPVAAPKSVDDLVVNTTNIGEMWGRLLRPGDRALNLINGPFAPAGYQLEKVLEYVGILSLRLWVDNVTGDYTRVLRLLDELSVNIYVGSPSRLLEMHHFALRHNEPPPRFDRLLLLAEQTGPAFLRQLERVTGAKAYVACYGSSETGTLAVTCEHGQMHLQTQSYLPELLDEHGNATIVDGAGGRGELVVTTLDLPARPLVRYRTGDLVEIDPTPCACGLTPPVLRTLGRAQDVVAMADGGVRQDDFETALWADGMPQPAVLSYMLVLRGAEVVCLATTDRPATPDWAAVVAARLGPLFAGRNFAVQEVDALPPLASMGSYVGWKLSRVLDLADPRMWDRLPAPIFDVVRRTLAEIEAKTGLRPLAA